MHWPNIDELAELCCRRGEDAKNNFLPAAVQNASRIVFGSFFLATFAGVCTN